ncbi:LysR family transcriptional regulator ArgP [Pseudomonas veronii]|uniref:LysR family transcriptional regulator ArgP n=1 Tax=Pseudomonas veronii TaxID=76761 RepID=UPI0021BF769E|nr:LysR family transcriptional regulator ArgP [Pseudomonas veronii]MCT8962821.1 LysR family transcriptional regulator ArgP [Pseudomonas veronii]
MDLIHPQLAAFAAVLEEGSFEGAGRRLCVTSSAVSQRIKALEDRLGQLLVVRQPPCRPTPAGELLLRRVRPMQTLEAEALADLLPEESQGARTRPIAIAVNSDSLITWFLPALSQLHKAHGYLFDLHVDDQDHTLELLRSGAVLGAVSGKATPLQGCGVDFLGRMRYQAIASPSFAARYFSQGVNAATFGRAPMISLNRKDELQWRFMRGITRAHLDPPMHYIPTPSGIVEAAALGLGWCLAPDSMLAPALKQKSIVILAPEQKLDVPLYWHHAAVRSSTLQQLAHVLTTVARGVLHQ